MLMFYELSSVFVFVFVFYEEEEGLLKRKRLRQERSLRDSNLGLRPTSELEVDPYLKQTNRELKTRLPP